MFYALSVFINCLNQSAADLDVTKACAARLSERDSLSFVISQVDHKRRSAELLVS